ncbi:MAG: hypothetical protein FVQ85_02810 [Planctomycetes bacterium]|nr:hypothetical protein [Planctomycetota bacterium]
MQFKDKYLTNIPLVVLVAANLIPLWGVVFWEWDAFNVVLLYWSENIVVGFYNILKMAFVKVSHPAEHLGKLFMIPFFTIHYGGFCAIHGFFVLSLFGKGEAEFMHGNSWPCFFVFLQMLLNVIKHAYSIMSLEMRYAMGALFLSHGVSFVYNYLIKGEYANIKIDKLMGSPYGRIVIMHMAVIFGAFLTIALGSPVGILIILVGLKTSLDVIFHLRQHKKHQGKTA